MSIEVPDIPNILSVLISTYPQKSDDISRILDVTPNIKQNCCVNQCITDSLMVYKYARLKTKCEQVMTRVKLTRDLRE